MWSLNWIYVGTRGLLRNSFKYRHGYSGISGCKYELLGEAHKKIPWARKAHSLHRLFCQKISEAHMHKNTVPLHNSELRHT
mmetsp:Transcript_4481/g.7691  ORF Transcript_4481/g.7691 Transcript_4481/m.7691 type:complete len:81 (-) Transcript_4481:380-622(-)